MKPRFDDPAARRTLQEKLAGLGERSNRKSYYPELQQRLAELERFRALLDQSSDAIFLLAYPGGQLVDVNESACRQLGLERAALLGRPLGDRLAPPSDSLLAGTLAAHLQASALRVQLRRDDGTLLPAEMSVRPVELDGERYAVAVARDTTERDALQARLAVADRMVSLGTLAAGVAHEVNNPLAYVVGNLDYLRRELEVLQVQAGAPGGAGLEPAHLLARLGDALAALRDAAEGADRVRRIVRDLKVFSRVDTEGRSHLDVRKVLDGALALANNEIRHRARLVKEYGAVPLVLANEGRLGQVFLNLLLNAAQSITDGAADRNEIGLRTWSEGGGAVVEVRDTGGGIAPEHLPRIFEPFFTTKPIGVGTGLGLSICHGFVAQLGGAIEVSSQPGIGTRFRIRLPAAATAAPEAEPAPLAPARRDGRLLLIDDDELAAASLRRLLSPPHRVELCTSARQALARLRSGATFDVILCDLMMPEMGGMDFFEVLQRELPGQARRVIFVTAGGFTPRARDFLGRAGAPWVEKPVSIPVLLAAIDAVAPDRAAEAPSAQP